MLLIFLLPTLIHFLDVERVGMHMEGKEKVELKKVKKEFVGHRQRNVAVNKLSLNFYEDQITSFLGHNGAGNPPPLFSLPLLSFLSQQTNKKIHIVANNPQLYFPTAISPMKDHKFIKYKFHFCLLSSYFS